jgi:hypothetical protein
MALLVYFIQPPDNSFFLVQRQSNQELQESLVAEIFAQAVDNKRGAKYCAATGHILDTWARTNKIDPRECYGAVENFPHDEAPLRTVWWSVLGRQPN